MSTAIITATITMIITTITITMAITIITAIAANTSMDVPATAAIVGSMNSKLKEFMARTETVRCEGVPKGEWLLRASSFCISPIAVNTIVDETLPKRGKPEICQKSCYFAFFVV